MKLLKYIHLTLTLLVFSIGITNAQQNTDYVDLGLPSGTLWATCNVGAAKPWEYGEYFAWGETRPNTEYSWRTYKYANEYKERLTKYCTMSKYGNYFFSDDLIQLESTDDAATARMGSKWRIPTMKEWQELINNCDCVRTHNYNGKGISGNVYFSKKYPNRHIFLPSAGYYFRDRLIHNGEEGWYWSSTLTTDPGWSPTTARAMDFCTNENVIFREADRWDFGYSERCEGLPIRAIR